jgi:hypothetical protein
MRRTSILLTLITFLALVGSALAMSSTNYRLDWFTPLTGSGGAPAASATYALNFTVGQAVIGVSSSDNFQACLGFWCEVARPWRVYLPLVLTDVAG